MSINEKHFHGPSPLLSRKQDREGFWTISYYKQTTGTNVDL